MANRAGSYFLKGGHSATQTQSIMNKHKVKHYRNSDTKTGYREPHQNHRLGTVSNELLGGGLKLVLRVQPHPL